MTYDDYISTKRPAVADAGFEPGELPGFLFPFQRDITRWAIRRGRAAIFADCGLGKTPMQLVWAHRIEQHTDSMILIVAPLAVSEQTCREGEKFGIPVRVVRDGAEIRSERRGIYITNYERMHHFDPSQFSGIVLDESSILKQYDGKRKGEIIDFSRAIPYRLACTATPAPNDHTELGNHAEFLGVMSEKEMKALFFTQDGNTTTKWRLKGHARQDFWRWVASWSVALRHPSDLGYADDGFVLPPINVEEALISFDFSGDELFPKEAVTLNEQRRVLRESLPDRVRLAAELVNGEAHEPFIVWCNLNAESAALKAAIPGAVEIKGSDTPEYKAEMMAAFSDERIRVLVTKPSIAGFGMNWQHCARAVFVGLSHSYEQFYQATRRIWRFGQKRSVQVFLVDAEANRRVVANLKRKEAKMNVLMNGVVGKLNQAGQLSSARQEATYDRDSTSENDWTMYLGDCVDAVHELADESVGLSVFSPPFPGMYVYSNSLRDMGNTSDIPEMINHMRFMVRPLLAKTLPGRHCCLHLTQGTAQKVRDGYIGLRDFRGDVIRMMEEEGWIYYGEVCIDKNPQVKAIRTKDRGLLFKTLAKDSSHMHMALADYLLQFRKPGDNPDPIMAGISERYKNEHGWITAEEWIRWARPVWYGADFCPDGDGIAETDVLNVSQARETNDERHLAPLQLGVIERAVKLWSNPGDLVYDPFTGIGSTGYVAIRLGRRFVGSELKRSYYEHAMRHLRSAVESRMQGTLFAMQPPDPRKAANGQYGYGHYSDGG